MPTLSVKVQKQIECSALYAEDQENDFSSAGIVLDLEDFCSFKVMWKEKLWEQEM